MKKHRTSRVFGPQGNGPNGLVELLQKAKSGDDTAVAQLSMELDAMLRSIAGRFGLGPADQLDVVQTVWVRFLEHRHAIRTPERALGWLRTTARREALRVIDRRLREEVSAISGADATAPRPTLPEEWAVRADRDRCLWRAAARLGPRDRLLALLVCSEAELTYATLAAGLQVAEGSVGKLRGRCFERLRRLLAAEGITDASL